MATLARLAKKWPRMNKYTYWHVKSVCGVCVKKGENPQKIQQNCLFCVLFLKLSAICSNTLLSLFRPFHECFFLNSTIVVHLSAISYARLVCAVVSSQRPCNFFSNKRTMKSLKGAKFRLYGGWRSTWILNLPRYLVIGLAVCGQALFWYRIHCLSNVVLSQWYAFSTVEEFWTSIFY